MSEQEIYIEAMNRQDAAERGRFLDQACGENIALRARLEKLIEHSDRVGSFLEHPPEPLTMTAKAAIEAEVIGTQIGPYQIRQQIGEGGFGVVFLAEQDRPVHRRVALKIIKPGMDTREVIARFEAERQALAMMDHPNIAKVYDAGGTENGRPYFVMELVQGVPITEYCDQCNLTTQERLELFITVCQAVQHAHQKGIIHRDIKPTNVLVAILDGRPTPKIIDFGVAKALSQRLTEHTLMTAFAQMVGTPLYMSPEQAELSPLGVDTRTDIYSLGVLLYELLTGTTPFDKDRLRAASYDELRRIIREEEAPRPSARISTLAGDLADTVAEHRRTDARRLRQTVHGELDWIVMKCLEKDRNRRYETPNGLARDLERYLHDEPVQACPPSTSYRLRKFARRNKALLAAGGAIAAALFVGLGLSTWMYFRERAAVQVAKANESRATTESARSKAISDLLQKMLASSNPDQLKGSKYTVRQLLDEFSAGLGDQLAGEPEVEATIRSVIGKSYWRLGVPDRAEIHLKKALDMQRKLPGDQDERVADILVDYSWNLAEQKRFAEAETHAREALAICQKRNSDPRVTMRALWSVTRFLVSQSRHAEAEQIGKEALTLAGNATDSQYPELPNILHTMADTKSLQGKYEEAEKLARQSVEIHRRLQGDRHPETAWGLLILGRALAAQHKHSEAEESLREALAIFREYYTPEHHSIHGVCYELKLVLEARGDRAGLDALAKEQNEQEMRPDRPSYHAQLARLLLTHSPSVDQKEEAHRQIRQAMEGYAQVAVESRDKFERRLKAADGYVGLIKICAAEPDFASQLDELNNRLTAELRAVTAAFPSSTECQWQTALVYRGWAFELIANKAYLPAAERAFRESIELLNKFSISERDRLGFWFSLAQSYAYLGDILQSLGRLDEAEVACRRAMKIYDDHQAEIVKEHTEYTLEITANCFRLSSLLLANNSQTKSDEARRLIRRAIQLSTQLAIDSRDDFDLRLRAADQYVDVAKVCVANSEFVDVVNDAHRRLLAELQNVLADFPRSSESESKVAERYRRWSYTVPNNVTYLPQVEHACGEAIKLYEKQLLDNRLLPRDLFFLAHIYGNLGNARWELGQSESAGAAFERAIEIYDQHPEVGDSDICQAIVQHAFIACYLASTGREREGTAVLQGATIYVRRLPVSSASADTLYRLAVAQARLGDKAGYRATCKALVGLPMLNAGDSDRSRPIWTPCLAPDALEDLSRQVKRAEEFLAKTPEKDRHFGLFVLGAAHYRAGQYKQAAERLEESIGAFPDPPVATNSINYPKLFLAMAKWQLGEREAARRLLAETLTAVEKELQSPSSGWNRRATLEVLRTEALALIEQNKPDEAVEKKDQSPNEVKP